LKQPESCYIFDLKLPTRCFVALKKQTIKLGKIDEWEMLLLLKLLGNSTD